MTRLQKERKLIKLKEKLDNLENKLSEENRREREVLSRRGWGYGMRHSKITFSTHKSDELKRRIQTCKEEITALEYLQ